MMSYKDVLGGHYLDLQSATNTTVDELREAFDKAEYEGLLDRIEDMPIHMVVALAAKQLRGVKVFTCETCKSRKKADALRLQRYRAKRKSTISNSKRSVSNDA